MPEGPEIRKAADRVANAILGKTVLKLEFGQPHLKKWQATFSNMMVDSVDTYGKAMVTRFVDIDGDNNKSSHALKYLYA